MSKFYLAFFLCFCGAFTADKAEAQQSAVTIGGDVYGAGGSVSFSVGQVAYTNMTSSTGTINQGVQQPISNATLPVTFLDFTATPKNKTVLLNWSTSTEMNSSHFNVQSSKDGLSFLTLSKVKAAGSSSSIKNYGSTDLTPFSGWNYYRIQQVDYDGRNSYTTVKPLYFSNFTMLSVYPNPAFNTTTLEIKNYNNKKLYYQLYDGNGRLVSVRTISNSKTNIDLSNFSAGTYVLKVIENYKEEKVFTLIKIK